MSLQLEDVERAAQRLAGVAHRTPVLTSRTLDERTGARVHLKAECFQRGGAFKFRGAFNKISSLDEAALRRGVLAYSSGNHAQAVAIAAGLLGSRATIVMPEDAPAAKLDATRGYGAEVVPYDRWTESREEIGARLAAERGLELVRPYDDPLVMAGQGTVALELLEDEPELDLLLVPMSGGGLMAGCATVAAARRPGIRLVGVEPAAGDDTRRSLAAGERVRIDVPPTIADGLQAAEPGELTFDVNRRLVDEVVVVTDEEIGARLAAERGLELVKPYDDPLVMAGQGTVAVELLEDEPELDLLLVPVSGGGLIAGCATVAKALRPGIRVVGVEPEAGDDTRRSLAAGERVRIDVPPTIADGLQATEPGELTFEVNRRLVDEIVTVSDEEIVEAMAFLFDRLKVVAEPSGAVGVAVLLSGKLDARGRSVGVVVSGGNVGAARFAELVSTRLSNRAG